MSNVDKNLGNQYPMTSVEEVSNTKDRILLEAIVMFAQKGYSAVSIRDIAARVNIKSSSIYNHFSSKEALWDAILDHMKNLYLMYFERLEKSISLATNFEQTLDYMFVELKDIVNIFTYYGFTLVQVEQYRDTKAYEIYSDIFLKYSINYIKTKFDACIEKEWVKEFDTKTVSTFFMHSVLTGIMLRTHEDLNHTLPYDVDEMYTTLQAFILKAAKGE